MTFQKFVGHILPGLRVEKTSSGVVIDVSTSGTTSVSTKSMAEIALMRYDELQQKQEANDLVAWTD